MKVQIPPADPFHDRLAGGMMMVKALLTVFAFHIYSLSVAASAYVSLFAWFLLGASLLPDLTRYRSRRLALAFLVIAMLVYGKNLFLNTVAGGALAFLTSLPDVFAATGVLLVLAGHARRLLVIAGSVFFSLSALWSLAAIAYKLAFSG